MTTGPAGPPRLQGAVTEFDEQVGLGRVAEAAGGPSFQFHCTQIADGSRTIDTGAAVSFSVRPARLGRWEAADVRPA